MITKAGSNKLLEIRKNHVKFKKFANFHDASTFARALAMRFQYSVKITRMGQDFVVSFIGNNTQRSNKQLIKANRPTPTEKIDWWEKNLEKQKRQAEQAEARRLQDEQRRKENRKRINERKSYLLQRKKYYRELNGIDLDQEWADRDENDLLPDEKELLRNIVRERKGITPAYGSIVEVCRSCGEVGENCTCGRSWF